jgi:hypothetical protein
MAEVTTKPIITTVISRINTRIIGLIVRLHWRGMMILGARDGAGGA